MPTASVMERLEPRDDRAVFMLRTSGTMYAIKTAVSDPHATKFAFDAQKTMYGGRHIAVGDSIYIFASENEGGAGLLASGIVTSAEAAAKKPGVERQAPRISIVSSDLR